MKTVCHSMPDLMYLLHRLEVIRWSGLNASSKQRLGIQLWLDSWMRCCSCSKVMNPKALHEKIITKMIIMLMIIMIMITLSSKSARCMWHKSLFCQAGLF